MGLNLTILLCDARSEPISLKNCVWEPAIGESITVGQALVALGVVTGVQDPQISRKGCFGVFGKRKDWDSPIYNGDRLELYSPLLIDPKTVRRKKANQNQDAKFQAAAAKRKARRL